MDNSMDSLRSPSRDSRLDESSVQDQTLALLTGITETHEKLSKLNRDEYEGCIRGKDILLKNANSKLAYANKKVKLLRKERDEHKEKVLSIQEEKKVMAEQNIKMMGRLKSLEEELKDEQRKQERLSAMVEEAEVSKSAADRERDASVYNQIRQLENQLQRKDDECIEKERELIQAKRENNKLKEEKKMSATSADSKMQFYQNKLESVATDLTGKERTIQEKDALIAKRSLEVRCANQKLKSSEEKCRAKDDEIKQVKCKVDELRDCLESTCKQNETKFEFFQQRVKTLSLELDEKKTLIKELEKIKNNEKSASSVAESRIQFMTRRIETLQSDLETKDKLLHQQKLSARQHDTIERNNLHEKVKKLESDLSCKTREQVQSSVQLAAAKKTANASKATIEDLSRELQLAKENLNKKEDELTRKLSARQHDTVERNNLHERVKKLESDLSCKTREQVQSSVQLAAAKKTANASKATIEDLSRELQLAKENLSQKEDELMMFKSDVKRLKKSDKSIASNYQQKLKVSLEKIEDLESQLEVKESKIEEISMKLAATTKTIKENKVIMEKQSRDLDMTVDNLNQNDVEMTKLRNDMERLKKSDKSIASNYQQKLKDSLEKIEDLENQLELKESNIEELELKLNRAESRMDSKKSTYKSMNVTLTGDLKKAQHEVHEKDEELYMLRAEVDKLQKTQQVSSSSTDNKLAFFQGKIKTLEKELGEKSNDLRQKEITITQNGVAISGLKAKVKQMEMEVQKKDIENDKLASIENHLSTKELDCKSEIKSLRRENHKLEASLSKMKEENEELNSKLTSTECELGQVMVAVEQKDRNLKRLQDLEKGRNSKKDGIIGEELNVLTRQNEEMSSQLQESEEQLHRRELEISNVQKKLTMTEEKVEKLKEDLKNKENELHNLASQAKENEEKLQEAELGLSQMETSQERTKRELIEAEAEVTELKKERDELNSAYDELEASCQQLHESNETMESKFDKLEKNAKALKETCILLERQAEDLETFNNELIEKQNAVIQERDDALSEVSKLTMQMCSTEQKMSDELKEIDQTSADRIEQLEQNSRETMQQLHQITDEHRDLERRYRMLELNAAAIQRKLTNEKEAYDSCQQDLEENKKENDQLYQSLYKLETDLETEMDRCDELEKKNTNLLNQFEVQQLENSHNLIRLNGTVEQQTKLIDFLHSRIEELEPSKKKKKKKDPVTYEPPMQYRQLRELLEEEKTSNVKLQERVCDLRMQLQATNANVKRMKMSRRSSMGGGVLSPGTKSAIMDIVKSPTAADGKGDFVTPKKGNGKVPHTKPRMGHNIPHRMSACICNQATRCHVCLTLIRFASNSLNCSECPLVCHVTCKKSLTNTCGLPGGLFKQYKDGVKQTTFSPISCSILKSDKKGNLLQGTLKVMCGNDTWKSRKVILNSSAAQMRILPPAATANNNSKVSVKPSDADDVIDLTQTAYIHTDVCKTELTAAAKQDLPYCFKVQTGVQNSCWPVRHIYFLASGFADKNHWVEKLEALVAKHNKSASSANICNPKIAGNEIFSMPTNSSQLEFICSTPMADEKVAIGAESGLYLFAPKRTQTPKIEDFKKVQGVGTILQIQLLNSDLLVAIEGKSKTRLVTLKINQIVEKLSCEPCLVADVKGCHLFATRTIATTQYICVAKADQLQVLMMDKKNKFVQRWSTSTVQPCCCLLFTPCSIIIGTDKFYEVDLHHFKVDEFMSSEDAWVIGSSGSIFPISVLSIKVEDGKEEFLLCYNDFGIFVDSFGQRTRDGMLPWSRMPLSFIYNAPYLTIIQFNSIEIIALNPHCKSATDSAVDRSFMMLTSARYLGPAITEGASYIYSRDSHNAGLFCFKGNMKHSVEKAAAQSLEEEKAKERYTAPSISGGKRHLHSSNDTLFSTMTTVTMRRRSPGKRARPAGNSDGDTSEWTCTSTTSGECEDIRKRTKCERKDRQEGTKVQIMIKSGVEWNPVTNSPKKPPRSRRPNESSC